MTQASAQAAIPPSEAPAPAAPAPAISVQGLVKRYGGRAVVDGLSFDVQSGEVFALLGPNGAGKTTTVEVLEGYRAADGGTVRVLGLDPQHDAPALRAQVGLMLQGGGVYPQARPPEILRLYASFFAAPEDPTVLLRLVGLERAAGTRYRRLSGGEKQRLSLALALVGKPRLVFLDEPTTAMDPQARRDTWGIIRGLKARGVTVLLTTHFMDEAEQLADRVAIVNRGRLVALDTPAGLRAGRAGELSVRLASPVDPGALGAHLQVPVHPQGNGRLLIGAAPSPRLIAALAEWCDRRDVLLTELQVGGGTLEDVYLQLTSEAAS